MSSNLPPGGGFTQSSRQFKQHCENGHEWEAEFFFELGGWFYADEDRDGYCPVCGLPPTTDYES
jgi:hypothetical protein